VRSETKLDEIQKELSKLDGAMKLEIIALDIMSTVKKVDLHETYLLIVLHRWINYIADTVNCMDKLSVTESKQKLIDSLMVMHMNTLKQLSRGDNK